MLEDEFELSDSIVSGSFDDQFDMGLVGTADGTVWYICWNPERLKTSLITSHRDRITGLISIDEMHIATSSLDGTIGVFRLEDRSEILRIHAERSVSSVRFSASSWTTSEFRHLGVWPCGFRHRRRSRWSSVVMTDFCACSIASTGN